MEVSFGWSVTLLLIFLLALCVIYFQDLLIFIPNHSSPRLKYPTPAGYDLWMVQNEPYGIKKEPELGHNIWFMCHGNGGKAEMRIEALDKHLPAGDGLYILEYPGYGQRLGKPSISSINVAASDAYKELLAKKSKYRGMKIGIIGESLGTGPAAYVTHTFGNPDHLILIAPYDSIAAVASSQFLIPSFLARFLVAHNWDNIDTLKKYNGKITIYYAKNDEVIAPEHAFKLYLSLKFANDAQFIATDFGHNDVYDSPVFKLCF